MTRPSAVGRTGSPSRRTGSSTTLRWPAATSPGSIPATGAATVVEPPTAGQGARRVWSGSTGKLWVSEWNAGQLAVYDPATDRWREWPLPGDGPQAYAVYVGERDVVWLSDFTAKARVRFDPATEAFESYLLPGNPANVRQIHGRPGEVSGAESGVDALVGLRVP